MKFLFEYITDSFSLLDNPFNDYYIMAIIGVIAYIIAFSLVGKLYRYDIIDGRGAGHFLHWIIRLFVFAIIFYATAAVIRVYSWFHGLPEYKWWIIGLSVTVVIAVYFICLIKNRNKRGRATDNTKGNHKLKSG